MSSSSPGGERRLLACEGRLVGRSDTEKGDTEVEEVPWTTDDDDDDDVEVSSEEEVCGGASRRNQATPIGSRAGTIKEGLSRARLRQSLPPPSHE